MATSQFIRRLEDLCDQSGDRTKPVSQGDFQVLVAKYLDSESDLLSEEGLHLFSFCHVIPTSAMRFAFDTIKHSRHPQLFYGVDSASHSPYHYAARYDMDEVFDHVVGLQRGLDRQRIKSLCLQLLPDTRHSVASMLIEKDRRRILESFMCGALGVEPFVSEFADTYVSWLHESVCHNARATCLYLCRRHNVSMQQSVLVGGGADGPEEHVTPLDMLLLSDRNRNKMFYVDAVLSGIPGGMKTKVLTYDVLLPRLLTLKNVSTRDASWVVTRCVRDNIIAKVGGGDGEGVRGRE